MNIEGGAGSSNKLSYHGKELEGGEDLSLPSLAYIEAKNKAIRMIRSREGVAADFEL